jgi:hypothetical protein
MIYDKRLKNLIKIYESMVNGPIETSSLMDIPYMEIVPRIEKDYACPYCHKLMGEKDYSFKYHPEMEAYTHTCNNKPFRMPSSDNNIMNESYGIESHKSGFKEVGEASSEDKRKIDEVVNDKSKPEEAEDGYCYEVLWAGGRGFFGCKYKKYLSKWLEKQGEWAEICYIKYKKNDKKLKLIDA